MGGMGSFRLSPEEWENAIISLQNTTENLSDLIEMVNLDGRGEEVAAQFRMNIAAACAAMDFVKNYASDCIEFIPFNVDL